MRDVSFVVIHRGVANVEVGEYDRAKIFFAKSGNVEERIAQVYRLHFSEIFSPGAQSFIAHAIAKKDASGRKIAWRVGVIYSKVNPTLVDT